MKGECIIKNFASSGTMINYINNLYDDILEFNPDLIIIMYGSVEAQIRPNVERDRFKLWSLTPKRYHIGGMLNPRPFYSKKFGRYVLDCLDNCFRGLLNKILFLTQGKCQWMNISRFDEEYRKVLDFLKQEGYKNIMMVSTIYLDDSIYNGSLNEYKKYNSVIEKIADDTNNMYVDIFKVLESLVTKDTLQWKYYYYKDNFHPNINGLKVIADIIVDGIKVGEYSKELKEHEIS